jgi:DNA-binding response OmpR family regulator
MLTQFSFYLMAGILLIEDDDVVRKALSRFLEKEGLVVQTASNGKEAMFNLDNYTYDLVITDLNMPYANGYEVMSWIRSQERHRAIPVIVITSMASESTITQCYNIGANDFVRKPIMPHELHIRIKKLLGQFA